MRNLMIAAAAIMALSAAPAFAAGGSGGGGTDNPATGGVRLASYARWNGQTWREASRKRRRTVSPLCRSGLATWMRRSILAAAAINGVFGARAWPPAGGWALAA